MKSSEKTMCPVCCEPFTGHIRKPIDCTFCDYSCCMTCVKKYMLNSFQDPHCMACKNPWNPEFIDKVLTRNFRINPLKKHREEVLFDRERSMLPDTQPFAERVKNNERVAAEISKVQKQIKDLQIQTMTLRDQFIDSNAEVKKDKRMFIMGCPSGGCKGFLNDRYKCGLCEADVCKECREEKHKDTEHVCDPGVVATIKLLAKDTQACPKCASQIHKISGCSQIFCVVCHIAFCWQTGEVVTNGVIHNPHYYEWIRANNNGEIPRDAGRPNVLNVPVPNVLNCNDQMLQIRDLIYRSFKGFSTEYADLQNCRRILDHMFYTTLRTEPLNGPDSNRDLRIAFILNKIDEKTLKTKVLTREKNYIKKKAVYDIGSMFYEVASDLFKRPFLTREAANEARQVLRTLKQYTNGEYVKLGERFKINTPELIEF